MITELVPASRLRPGDQLVTTEGLLNLREVERDPLRVRLVTGMGRGDYVHPTRDWSVPLSTVFRRLVQSRRIEMRPDLRRGED